MLSNNNWIEMNWEGLIPRRMKENFSVHFKDKAEKIYPYDEICDITALEIANKYDNLYIGMSGGADSEHVANVFYRNKIPFTPIMVTWEGWVNPETKYAFKWCKDRNITPVTVHHDWSTVFHNGVYKHIFNTARPRGLYGVTNLLMNSIVTENNGNLILGMQMEYHPDEQFKGDEGIPKDYRGFLINEADAYYETIAENRHPWAFFYWTPEILASTAYHWDTSLDLTEAKAKLYDTPYRPKLGHLEFAIRIPKMYLDFRDNVFGTIDCALLGDKDELLAKLVK